MGWFFGNSTAEWFLGNNKVARDVVDQQVEEKREAKRLKVEAEMREVEAKAVREYQEGREKLRKQRREDEAWVETTQKTLDADDLREMEEAKSWVPPVEVRTYAAGDFLVYDGQEWPRRFITDIAIDGVGGAPRVDLYHTYGCSRAERRVRMGFASVTVTLSSGLKSRINVSRHKVLFLHEALVQAWKHQEGGMTDHRLSQRPIDASRITAGRIEEGTITSFHYWRGKYRSWHELTEQDKVWIKAARELEDRLKDEEEVK